MKIRMWSNELEVSLTPFIGKYVGNVCLAIVASLKTPEPVSTLRFDISVESVRIMLNGSPLPLNLGSGFAEKMILDTIRGMIRLLRMADPSGAIRIDIDLNALQPPKTPCDQAENVGADSIRPTSVSARERNAEFGAFGG